MNRDICTFQYVIPEIPDPACTKYKIIAGGNIRDSIASGCGHLLRTLSQMPPGQAWAKLIFVFKPTNGNLDMQSRLKLILEVGSDNEDTLSSLQKLIQGGLLSRFYDFNSSGVLLPDSGKLNCRCNVIRRQDFLRPLYNCEFNHKIPELYYTMTPFEANGKNDYLILDKVLDRVDEEVTVGIKVTPADIARQLHVHTAYLARLNSINRNWDDDYEDSGNFNYTGLEASGYKSNHTSLKPLSYKDPMADDVLRRQRRFHESLSLPHLYFEIEVSTQTLQSARLIGSVVAESAFRNGSYRLILNSEDKRTDNIPQIYKELMNLSNVATVDELIGAFCLPVGSSGSPLCIRKNTDPEYIEPDKLIVLGYDQHNLPRGIHINVLKKHCAVLGLSGVGKNTNNINIDIQLSERDIPFLVIESAKTEYRVLKKFSSHKNPAIKKLAKELRVFTVGSETSPLAINPLRIPVGISINEHIENLLACFKAVLPVSSGSIPSLLGEALEIVYEQFPDPGKPPVMSDLVATVQQVLDSKGYSPNTRSDMQTVIEVRLGVLAQRLIGKVFGCRKGISIAELMENPTIVEIDKLCGEQKCLLTLFILMGIREVLRTSPSYEGPLRFAILIEEAHNIFGSSNAVASEEVADPKSQLTEFLFQMMVELRALGVAIILSDQHPSSLDPGAIKTPASKVGFLQVANEDREELGGSMLFNEIEKQDIARFRPG
ncbi:MAG: hypothetical protein PHP01_00625, partial [Phycisphaerae bacterium]|nr:hypothetical protein [Phycisphaerae bacterium]